MAKVPDVCIVNFWRLTAAEIKLFCFYCKVRNHDDGGWEIEDKYAASETRLSRSRVTEGRNGLEKKGWIKIMYVRNTYYYIAPFFGFVVENSTYLDEISTKLVENSTAPLKELPAQLPTQFTREGADESALAQPDENSKSQSAGKPAVAAPTKKRNRRSSAPRPPAKRKPTDTSIDHPAVQMVKEITGRFPRKEFWKQIAEEIGDKPDVEFFRRSYVKWRGFRGHPETYNKWLFDPNKTGNLPETYGANGNGNGSGKPVDVPKNPITTDAEKPQLIGFDERILKAHLDDLRNEGLSDEDLTSLEENYTSESWAWLMENLKNA